MKETIAAIRIRHVFAPPLASYSAPHAIVIDPIQQAYDQGWNACMAHLKAAGKI
jgi:hypothetical protein